MRQPRFRLRTLLIGVAVAGMVLGGAAHVPRLAHRSRFCAMKATAYAADEQLFGEAARFATDPAIAAKYRRKADWYARLRRKWVLASRIPFLPVAPDPPPPD
jgi:hypothetical protein